MIFPEFDRLIYMYYTFINVCRVIIYLARAAVSVTTEMVKKREAKIKKYRTPATNMSQSRHVTVQKLTWSSSLVLSLILRWQSIQLSPTMRP